VPAIGSTGLCGRGLDTGVCMLSLRCKLVINLELFVRQTKSDSRFFIMLCISTLWGKRAPPRGEALDPAPTMDQALPIYLLL
jgi:hypothetical protein